MDITSQVADLLIERIASVMHLEKEAQVALRSALWADLSTRAQAVVKSDQIAIAAQMNLIGANNRSSSLVAVSVAATMGVRSVLERAIVAKQPHHFLETGNAVRASSLNLGPRVFYADESIIIEELLPSEFSWRAVTERGSYPDGALLGVSLLQQYQRMIEHRLVHRLDSLPDHLFVLGAPSTSELRWIDWGRPHEAPEPEAWPDWQVVQHFTALVELLLNVPAGPAAYRAMTQLAHHQSGTSNSEYWPTLLSNVQAQLCNQRPSLAAEVFAPRWKHFFEEADALGRDRDS